MALEAGGSPCPPRATARGRLPSAPASSWYMARSCEALVEPYGTHELQDGARRSRLHDDDGVDGRSPSATPHVSIARLLVGVAI